MLLLSVAAVAKGLRHQLSLHDKVQNGHNLAININSNQFLTNPFSSNPICLVSLSPSFDARQKQTIIRGLDELRVKASST